MNKKVFIADSIVFEVLEQIIINDTERVKANKKISDKDKKIVLSMYVKLKRMINNAIPIK